MNEELELETYLNISPEKIGIYLFDKRNYKNIFEKEYKFKDNEYINYKDILIKFLEVNILKIEKLSNRFVENIFLIIENKNINYYEIGIRKKNFQDNIDKKYLVNILTELKDLVKESYPNQKIIHILITRYLIDGNEYLFFQDKINGNCLSIEVKFISISPNLSEELENIFEKFQIKIIQYLDGDYIKDQFKGENRNMSEMAFKIKNNYNKNEVSVVQKSTKNLGFFEKFFQLFS